MKPIGKTCPNKKPSLRKNWPPPIAWCAKLVGVIRVNAKDIRALADRNLQSALDPGQTDFLQDIAGQSSFPGMAEINQMVAAVWRPDPHGR